MDIGSISAALSSTKALLDIAKLAVAARDDAKLADALQSLKERIFDIQNAALQAQEKMSAMQDQIESLKDDKRELSARVADLEQRKAERERYRLHELTQGVFVLARVEPSNDGGPMHYICQSCMDNASKKVVLQRQQKSGRVNLVCNQCEGIFFTGETYTMQGRPLGAFR